MSKIAHKLLMSKPGAAHPIDQSLMFNSSDSAYISRTPSSASNRKTWTWSGWVKRGKLSDTHSDSDQVLFGAYDNSSASNSTYFTIRFLRSGFSPNPNPNPNLTLT